MPNATSVQIADAVVETLNGATLSQPFTACRYYLPEFDAKEMDALHVSVVPAELDVMKQDPPGLDTAAIDGLMRLVEEIDDLFRHKPLSGYPEAHWTKTKNKPIYDPKHLKEHNQFTSLLVFTFRVTR
jgi:hypothetical protein